MSANTAVAGQRITAAWLNTNIPGPWQTLTFTPINGGAFTNVNSWAAPQYRLFNSVTVEVIFYINMSLTTAITAPAQVATLAAGFRPASTQSSNWFELLPNTAPQPGGRIDFASSGAISFGNVATTVGSLGFHGFVSLDS